MLQIERVNKYYGSFQALKNLSLTINEGEFAAILGESGSGKSTLLNLISGLDTFDSGDIRIDGISVKNLNKKEFAVYRNNYVGFVFQEYNLIEHLTVIENVELPLLLQGNTHQESRERALEKCRLLGLSNHVNKLPKKLSGGQQQRTAIARALVTEPKVLLADEPTGALDSENAEIILDILKVISKDRIVILVTHDEEFAKKYATRIIEIEDGEIKSDSGEKSADTSKTERLKLKRPNMKFSLLWKFAKNNLKRRFLRTVFTALTMSIGLISIFLIIFLVSGIKSDVYGFTKAVIPPEQYLVTSELNHALLSDAQLQMIRNEPIVEEAYFEYNIIPLKSENGGLYPADYVMTGIPSKANDFYASSSIIGSYPARADEVIITSAMAEELLNIYNIKEKDLPEAFNELKDRVINIKQVSSQEVLDKSYSITGILFSSTKTVFALNTELERLAGSVTAEDILYFYTSSGVTLSDKTQVTVFLNSDNKAKITELTNTLESNGLVLQNPVQEVYHFIDHFFTTVLYILLGTASVSLVVSGILVGLIIYISVMERVKEIGILTSLGAKPGNIRSLFISESGIIGFLSAIIAFGFALFITWIINIIFNNTIGSFIKSLNILGFPDFKLMHPDIISGLLVSAGCIVYAAVCGLIPAFKASRLRAVEALRKE